MDTYDILLKNKCRGVIHCFSGSLEMAKKYIELGFYLGIGGVLTFKNSNKTSLPKITFKTNEEELKEKVKSLLQEHPKYEVYNIMNSLFEETIPKGYIYKVSHIVKVCAELMKWIDYYTKN